MLYSVCVRCDNPTPLKRSDVWVEKVGRFGVKGLTFWGKTSFLFNTPHQMMSGPSLSSGSVGSVGSVVPSTISLTRW